MGEKLPKGYKRMHLTLSLIKSSMGDTRQYCWPNHCCPSGQCIFLHCVPERFNTVTIYSRFY